MDIHITKLVLIELFKSVCLRQLDCKRKLLEPPFPVHNDITLI